MSYPSRGELAKLRARLRRQKAKLNRLKSIVNPSIWEKIELRLENLKVITTQEKIDKLIQEMVNSTN